MRRWKLPARSPVKPSRWDFVPGWVFAAVTLLIVLGSLYLILSFLG